MGLVEVLVASAILGISLAVMLANMSTMVVGARIADRRTGEERLVRNQIETLMAAATPTCSPAPAPRSATIDGTLYTVKIKVTGTDPTGAVVACPTAHYLQYKVTATDPREDPLGSRGVALSVGRYRP